MAGSARISQKRIKHFQQRFYGIAVALFFLVTTFVLLSALGQNQDPRRQAARPSMRTTACSEFSRSWGEWCVYTFTDDQPESLLPMQTTSGVTAWFRDGSWNLVASGLMQATGAQAQMQALYRFETNDRYGLANWQLVPGARAGGALLDGTDVSAGLSADETAKISILHPDVLPVETLALTAAGSSECCDTLFFTAERSDTEKTIASAHRVSLLPWDATRVERVTQAEDDFETLIVGEFTEEGVDRESIRMSRALYDAGNGQFYLLFTQGSESARVGLATSSWVNTPYSMVTSTVFGSQSVLNPQVVRDAAGTYHAFYTLADAPTEIWSARSDRITGPYTRQRMVMAVPEGVGIKQLSAPFLVCNQAINQWQLYFVGMADSGDQQLHTAFLTRGCNQPPVL